MTPAESFECIEQDDRKWIIKKQNATHIEVNTERECEERIVDRDFANESEVYQKCIRSESEEVITKKREYG